MNANPNEPGKILGINIFQPKTVQKAFNTWADKTYPIFKYIRYMFIAMLGVICVIYIKLSIDNVIFLITAIVMVLIYILILNKYRTEYDKQAPEDLKLR